MKKTFLLPYIFVSSFSFASGQVNFENSFNYDTDKKIKSVHKLNMNIKENNILLETELSKKDNLDGFVRIGFDNEKLSSFVKHEFNSKKNIFDAIYKYDNSKFSDKLSSSFEFDVFKLSKINFSNEFVYKFNDNIRIKNSLNIYSSINGTKDKIVIPIFLKNNEIKDYPIDLYGFSSKISYEYDINKNFKIESSINAKYDDRRIDELIDSKVKHAFRVKPFQRTYGIDIDAATKYSQNNLKSSLKLDYGYKNVYDFATTGTINVSVDTFQHSFGIDTNLEYLYDFNDGFKIVPSLNANFKGVITNFVGKESQKVRSAKHEKYTFKLEPSTKLEYMHDKFTASLKLDVPVNFEARKYTHIKNTDEISELTTFKVDDFDKKNTKNFGFENISMKLSFGLGYKW